MEKDWSRVLDGCLSPRQTGRLTVTRNFNFNWASRFLITQVRPGGPEARSCAVMGEDILCWGTGSLSIWQRCHAVIGLLATHLMSPCLERENGLKRMRPNVWSGGMWMQFTLQGMRVPVASIHSAFRKLFDGGISARRKDGRWTLPVVVSTIRRCVVGVDVSVVK
jgi:hypothetical protein